MEDRSRNRYGIERLDGNGLESSGAPHLSPGLRCDGRAGGSYAG